MDPDYDASDELEYGINWFAWILRGVYPLRRTRRCERPMSGVRRFGAGLPDDQQCGRRNDPGPTGRRMAVVWLRVALVITLGVCLWTAGQAKAAAVEYLMVPSAAMGRDIPVAFSGGGPHAVLLLDAFNAGEAVSNWVSAGDAMDTLAGKGISVVAPAGGGYSLYTDWEQDGSRQWETFLAEELPAWLAAHKGLAMGGHAVVGVSQGGTAALNTGSVSS